MEISFTPADLRREVAPIRESGAFEGPITGLASLETARPGDLSFLGNAKYRGLVATTGASVLLLPEDFEDEAPEGKWFLHVPSPSATLGRLCEIIEERLAPPVPAGIHPSALVEPSATLADEVTIGPFCYVAGGVKIGRGTRLHSHVSIGPDCEIGEDADLATRVTIAGASRIGHRVRILPGAVIGADGFGYETIKGAHRRLPQVGRVILEDDVEVGANTTIDRARFEATVIGQGTKIDNLVQIAHNVRLGKGCLLAAQVGIAGSTVVGDNVMIGGQAGLAGHISVGSRAIIGGQSAVIGDVEEGQYVHGSPYLPQKQHYRLEILRRRLPELYERVSKLEKSASPPSSSAS